MPIRAGRAGTPASKRVFPAEVYEKTTRPDGARWPGSGIARTEPTDTPPEGFEVTIRYEPLGGIEYSKLDPVRAILKGPDRGGGGRGCAALSKELDRSGDRLIRGVDQNDLSRPSATICKMGKVDRIRRGRRARRQGRDGGAWSSGTRRPGW